MSYVNPLTLRFADGFFAGLPRTPGVYFWVGERDEILYIGKAKSLRHRLASYRRYKPGMTPEHLLELVALVRAVRWEEHRTDTAARRREKELLLALRPPYNIADTHEEHSRYVGFRGEGAGSCVFRWTSRERGHDGFELYGCFPAERRIKLGYLAFLRVLHAAVSTAPRFSFPARISRPFAPFEHRAVVPEAWRAPLDRFLLGKSARLLELMVEAMLLNERIPRFMYPAIQDDIDLAREFFRRGPRWTARFKSSRGIRGRLLSQERMDELIRGDVAPWSET